jgi:hypothetical protein
MKQLGLMALCVMCLFVTDAYAQPDNPMARVLAGMRTHTLTGQVVIANAEGEQVPAPAGMDVGFQVKVFGRAKKGPLMFKTEAGGQITFKGIRSNVDPSVQAKMSYEAFVDYQDVRFPFPIEMIPTDGMALKPFTVYAISRELSDIALTERIDIIPSEQSLHVMLVYELINRSRKAVDLSNLPEGGLLLPCPEGAKQPEIHENNKTDTELRGTDLIYRGTILPQSESGTTVRVSFTIPYRSSTFSWRQTLPVETLGFSVATPLTKGRNHVRAIRLQLKPTFEGPTVHVIDGNSQTKWRVLKASGIVRKSGEPVSFDIGNIPVASQANIYFMVGSIIVVSLLILLGFRGRYDTERTYSKAHLVDERERLLRALARLKKAGNKGLISENKTRKEEEAIRARLVSLYRAIDSMDAG